MDHHVKIEGVCVGMSKAEAWEILKDKGFDVNPRCIYSKGTILFLDMRFTISYVIDDLQNVEKIRMIWTKDKETNKRIESISTSFAIVINHFNTLLPPKKVEDEGFSKRCEYIDLYNRINIYKQDSRDEGKPKYECVTITISDFTELIEGENKSLISYARSSFILRSLGNGYWQNNGVRKKRNFDIGKKTIGFIFKAIALVLVLFLLYIVASNYRYETFKDKSKYMRYDKWEQVYEKYDQHSKKWIRNY